MGRRFAVLLTALVIALSLAGCDDASPAGSARPSPTASPTEPGPGIHLSFIQQRFDEGERPTYDSVTVVLPTETKFDDEFAKEIESPTESLKWCNMSC